MRDHEVIFRGGLGNQLFCLLQAYELSFKYNIKVSINLINYKILKRNDRRFVLGDLFPQIEDEFKINKGISSLFRFIYAGLYEKYIIKDKFNRLPGDRPFSLKYLPQKYIHSGYFQKISNSKINKKSLNLLKKSFDNFLGKNKINHLAIHLRRGDYLIKQHKMHGVIPEKYLFSESLKQIKKHNYEGVTIFSDSPDLIDLNSFKPLHENITIDYGGKETEVFKRMANHNGLVASNSSFSLWAGILGDIKNFSIPSYWIKNVDSSVLGLEYIPRYYCELI